MRARAWTPPGVAPYPFRTNGHASALAPDGCPGLGPDIARPPCDPLPASAGPSRARCPVRGSRPARTTGRARAGLRDDPDGYGRNGRTDPVHQLDSAGAHGGIGTLAPAEILGLWLRDRGDSPAVSLWVPLDGSAPDRRARRGGELGVATRAREGRVPARGPGTEIVPARTSVGRYLAVWTASERVDRGAPALGVGGGPRG
jgi:hypothetical protein